MSDNLIERISTALAHEATLEGLVRQLLEMLELATNMESTYLTRIDIDASQQHILFARNSHSMQIPEGLSVPWGDTLCKRALDEGKMYTCDVGSIWGDSVAAKALGITTYLSSPVILPDGSLYGTLCAASAQHHLLSEKSAQMLKLFAQLIAQQIRNEQLMMALQNANTALVATSYTDDLTGLPNRRYIFEALPGLFNQAVRQGNTILVAFIDLDGFKHINDDYGHDAGDAFLKWIGSGLHSASSGTDIIGRIGGDEFLLIQMGPSVDQAPAQEITALKARLDDVLVGDYQFNHHLFYYSGPSIGVVAVDPQTETPDSAIRHADAAMYQEKRRRKQRVHGAEQG